MTSRRAVTTGLTVALITALAVLGTPVTAAAADVACAEPLPAQTPSRAGAEAVGMDRAAVEATF